MEGVPQYFLRVICTAIVGGLCMQLIGSKGTVASVCKLACGLAVAFAVIAPLADLRLSSPGSFWEDISIEASQYAQDGEEMAVREMARIIKEQTQAYIQDKAAVMDAEITVRAEVSVETLPKVERVHIIGNLSPYQRQKLQEVMEQELGIAKERQIWSISE